MVFLKTYEVHTTKLGELDTAINGFLFENPMIEVEDIKIFVMDKTKYALIIYKEG